MSKKVPIHRWKSKRLIDGTGEYFTVWKNNKPEALGEISKYNDRELYEELTLMGAVYRSANSSKLDTILEKGIDRSDTLDNSKMFWASTWDDECIKYGGDRKAIMAYDPSKIAHTTEQERIQPNVEVEFQDPEYNHIYRFLTNPLDALITVILIEPEKLETTPK